MPSTNDNCEAFEAVVTRLGSFFGFFSGNLKTITLGGTILRTSSSNSFHGRSFR